MPSASTMIEDELDSARDTISALRESWSWLRELVEPGWETSLAPVLTDEQRERIARLVRDERAERAARKATGLGPLTERLTDVGVGALGPSPAAARIGVIDAAVAVRQLVLEAARSAAESRQASYVGSRSGDRAFDDALAYLDGGPPRWIASTTGVIGYAVFRGAINNLDLVTLDRVLGLLKRADKLARAVSGVDGEQSVRFPHPCPACGHRSLQWTMPSQHDKRRWSVACIRDTCRCSGQGCGCRHAVRFEGRRHAWSYGELDGTWGLWRAIAAARRLAPPIRSGAAGHGGWPERK